MNVKYSKESDSSSIIQMQEISSTRYEQSNVHYLILKVIKYLSFMVLHVGKSGSELMICEQLCCEQVFNCEYFITESNFSSICAY